MSDMTTDLADGEDLEIAHYEDFGINRDEDGDLIPVKQRIPGTEQAVKVKPLVGGAIDSWDDVLDGANADDERVDAFFREYIEEGIGSEGIDNVPDYLVPGLIEAVKNSSGYEVFQHLQEKQEERDLRAFQQMDNMPEGMMERIMDMDDIEEKVNGADS